MSRAKYGSFEKVRVKICGTTSVTDALLAAESGADAVGFVMAAESPRYVSVGTAADIARRLPPFIARVGVFVNASADTIKGCMSEFLDYVQLHGDETPEMCRALARDVGADRIIRAVRVRSEQDVDGIAMYDAVGAVLLDAHSGSGRGGTGRTFDWSLAERAKSFGKPVILAGGLGPENVAEAIKRVRPYGVDVVTGVETRAGVKDAEKVRQFIANARTADAR